jgi:hypothetical protein
MKNFLMTSIPRSGTTYLSNCIFHLENSYNYNSQGFKIINKVRTHYMQIGDLRIYKAHYDSSYLSFFDESIDGVIYCYGNVIDSVVSSKHKGFSKRHMENCGYFGNSKNIFKEDFLNFEKTFDSWKRYDGNILRLNYDYIGTESCFNQLSEFLGVDIARLQKHKRRIYSVKDCEIKQAMKTYESLIQKINNLDKGV